MKIHSFNLPTGNYSGISPNGSTPGLNLAAAQIIPIPQNWLTHVDPNYNVPKMCYSHYPLQVSLPLPPQIMYVPGTCFPVDIPPSTSYYFLLEMNVLFFCPNDEMGFPQMHEDGTIARGAYSFPISLSWSGGDVDNPTIANQNFDIDFGCNDGLVNQWRIGTSENPFPSFSINPNIITQQLNLKCKVIEPGLYSLRIYDSKGALVETIWEDQVLEENTYGFKFNLGHIRKGYYLAKIESNSYQKSIPFIKN